MHRTLIATFLALSGALGLGVAVEQKGGAFNSRWVVPEDARMAKNPVPLSPQVSQEGLALYKTNCLTCHGVSGKGDGPAAEFIESAPSDISSSEVQRRMTGGEIFWKITEGRNPMPSFKKKLSTEERWKLVYAVRDLAVR